MCEHEFSGCVCGSGGWEWGCCVGYLHKFGFVFVTIVCIMFSLLRHCIGLLIIIVSGHVFTLSDSRLFVCFSTMLDCDCWCV